MKPSGWNWRLRRTSSTGTGEEAGVEFPSSADCQDCRPPPEVKQFTLDRPLPPTVTDDDVAIPLPGTMEAVVGDRLVVLKAIHPVPHVMNASGAMVWQAVDGNRSVSEIARSLGSELGIDPGALGPDVRATIAALRQAGFLRLRHDPLPPSRPTSPTEPETSRHTSAELDRTPWACRIGPIRVAGSTVLIRVNAGDLAEEASSLLRSMPLVSAPADHVLSLVDSGAPDPGRFRCYVDGAQVWSQADAPGVPERFVSQLNELASTRGQGHAVLHAGAVARQGRAILVVGRSGRGKSTLVAELVRRGFLYLTDEAAAIDVTSAVVRTYPKPLSLDRNSLELLGLSTPDDAPTPKRLVAAQELGTVGTDAPVGMIVALTGQDGPGDDEDQTPIDVLVHLLSTAFEITYAEPRSLDALARLVERTPAVFLDRMALTEAADRVEAAFDAAIDSDGPSGAAG